MEDGTDTAPETSNLSALREWEDHARNNAWLVPLTIFILGYII